METEFLLDALEQRLLWLKKQKYTYLNLPTYSYENNISTSEGPQIASTGAATLPNPISIQEKTPLYNKASQQDSIENDQKNLSGGAPLGVDGLPHHQHSGVLPKNVETLDNLYQQHCQCQRCPLGSTRTHFVFGGGSPRSSIVFIGEGPGAEEDRTGEPFVGKAGKLLTQMIQAIGIGRSDVYITNAVKCRPPNNRNPVGEEIAKCFPILQRQLELINPKLIVTLGNVPTRTLIQSAPGITKARGQAFHYQNWNVLPTFHPAYLLRNPSALSLAWDDFKKIRHICFES